MEAETRLLTRAALEFLTRWQGFHYVGTDGRFVLSLAHPNHLMAAPLCTISREYYNNESASNASAEGR